MFKCQRHTVCIFSFPRINRYWHRSLNPKKLIEVKFSHLSRNMTMQRHLKLYRLPDKTKTEGLRQLTKDDVKEACALLNEVRMRSNQMSSMLSMSSSSLR